MTVKPCQVPALPSGLIEVPARSPSNRSPKRRIPLASPVALTVGRLSPDCGALPVVLTEMTLSYQTVKASPVTRALLGGGVLASLFSKYS